MQVFGVYKEGVPNLNLQLKWGMIIGDFPEDIKCELSFQGQVGKKGRILGKENNKRCKEQRVRESIA